MGLHDRIKGGENGSDPEEQAAVNLVGPEFGDDAKPEKKTTDPYAELKTRVHHACIAKLGPQLFTTGTSENLSERVLRGVTAQLRIDRTPLTREDRRRIVREITDDIPGSRPPEPLL